MAIQLSSNQKIKKWQIIVSFKVMMPVYYIIKIVKQLIKEQMYKWILVSHIKSLLNQISGRDIQRTFALNVLLPKRYIKLKNWVLKSLRLI